MMAYPLHLAFLERGGIWAIAHVRGGNELGEKWREEGSLLMTLLVSWGPMLLLIGVWIFFMRQMQGGGKGGAFSFGKSKARMLDENNNQVTFADVAGCDEAKEEVKEVVDFLKDPQKFQKLGGRIPRGLLLVGPPGTGKTLLAKSIAGEAKVPFFSISGSDFVEMFVGVGASRVVTTLVVIEARCTASTAVVLEGHSGVRAGGARTRAEVYGRPLP